MNRTSIINAVIDAYKYKKYLEVGVYKKNNFNKVYIEHKDGVDPNEKCNYKMTADEFFNKLPDNYKYDIIFIDGLHLKEQVEKDITNALAHLEDRGTIIIHDCNPKSQFLATEVRGSERKEWCGTTWEAFAHLRMTRKDLKMFVIDADYGCGIIQRGEQKLFPKKEISYDLLKKERKNLLNLITKGEFINFIAKEKWQKGQ